MTAICRTLLLQMVCLAALMNSCFGSYAITTPRKWTPGEKTQVCVVLYNATAESNNEIAVELTSEDEREVVLPRKVIHAPKGEKTWCTNLFLPEVSHRSLQMKVTGWLADEKVFYVKRITVAKDATKTFIQTDKPLYKPGQDVQFRILTVAGPFLSILKTNYDVWIETPSGIRIAQWTNVDNSDGLIHLTFTLADEPEEGQYSIHVRLTEGDSITSHTFKVEDYVLPPFEVSVIPPKYVLGSDTEFTFTVCAKNPFGHPVTGEVILEIDGCSWATCEKKHGVRGKISGCKEFNFTSPNVNLNGEDLTLEKLVAKATVIEEGKDQEIEGEASTPVHETAVQYTVVDKEELVKPNLPFNLRIRVALQDNSPLADEVMELCIDGKCRQNLRTGPDGILELVIPPLTSIGSVTVQPVSYPESNSTSLNFIFLDAVFKTKSNLGKHYYSPSNSSLVIHAPEGRLPCTSDGLNHTLQVLFAAVNQTKALVSVQVVSRGQIQFSSAEEYEFSPSSLPFKEEHLLAPLPPAPEDTIIGVLKIPIQLPPSVSPSAKVVVWYTRPDGEVVSDVRSIAVEKCLDNDVDLVWSSDRVLPGAQATLKLSASPNSLCSLGVVDKSVESTSSGIDELTLGKVFDVVEKAMAKEKENPQSSDKMYCRTLQERNQPGTPTIPKVSRHLDALKMFDISGLYILTDLTTETRPCMVYDLRKLLTILFGPKSDAESGGSQSDADQQRTSLPETWLWKINMTDASGVLSEEYTVPDTITEWVGKAVCVSPETGLGISQRAAITTFTPFLVDLTLPPSIKRGEILPLKISVFNYLEKALPVKVILEESSDYEILENTEHGLPRGHSIASIPAKQKIVFTVKIRPLALGDVNITINTLVQELSQEDILSKRDVLIKLLKVEAEGFPTEYTSTHYYCLKRTKSNELIVRAWSTWVPPGIVEGSAKGWVTLDVDLLGPTLENLGSLVKMPNGCSEQNMGNFASNIVILQYLEALNQTSPDIKRKAIDFLKQGYQRELHYRHENGSYSAFGGSDASGSTWMTAFVLKSFAQARQYIQIDEEDLKRTRDWLEMRQQENGCFQSVGKAFNKGMEDGSSILTSYVLIALLESGELSTSKVAMDAANCLHADTSNDTYTLALKAYALALSEAPEANQTLEDLLNVATENSISLYWKLPAGSGKSEAVETAGYALLAMMTLDPNLYGTQARKIVNWISSQRNGQGGFISTQDTVVALQALASYEVHRRKDPLFLLIRLSVEGDQSALFLRKSMERLQIPLNQPSIYNHHYLQPALGEGCFLVQTNLRYNVPEATESDVFALNVSTETVPDKKCITKRIKACASYLLPNETSNMAIMEFNLVSGYIPHKDDLKQLVGNGTGLLKRYEVDGSKIYFYIDEFSAEDTCVQFRIIREIDVEDAKPGTVRVYSYHQPEFSNGQTYSLPPADDCQIEGVPLQSNLLHLENKLPNYAIEQLRKKEIHDYIHNVRNNE